MIWLITTFLIQTAFAANSNPMPSPIFLKAGYSSIVEFQEAPTQVVLGDSTSFQIERLNRSIVIRPLASYASTNMFVYFKTAQPKLFILTASEDAEPTLFRKVESFAPPHASLPKPSLDLQSSALRTAGVSKASGISLIQKTSDKKGDYVTLDVELTADDKGKVIPDWSSIRLKYKDRFSKPSKVWSERREVQRGSTVRARAVFVKPNVPKDMKKTSLIVPLVSSPRALILNLGVESR